MEYQKEIIKIAQSIYDRVVDEIWSKILSKFSGMDLNFLDEISDDEMAARGALSVDEGPEGTNQAVLVEDFVPSFFTPGL